MLSRRLTLVLVAATLGTASCSSSTASGGNAAASSVSEPISVAGVDPGVARISSGPLGHACELDVTVDWGGLGRTSFYDIEQGADNSFSLDVPIPAQVAAGEYLARSECFTGDASRPLAETLFMAHRKDEPASFSVEIPQATHEVGDLVVGQVKHCDGTVKIFGGEVESVGGSATVMIPPPRQQLLVPECVTTGRSNDQVWSTTIYAPPIDLEVKGPAKETTQSLLVTFSPTEWFEPGTVVTVDVEGCVFAGNLLADAKVSARLYPATADYWTTDDEIVLSNDSPLVDPQGRLTTQFEMPTSLDGYDITLDINCSLHNLTLDQWTANDESDPE